MTEPDEFAPSWLLMPEDALLALGKLTTSYSLLEFTLHQLVWRLSHQNHITGSILTARLDGPALRARVGALYGDRKPPGSPEVASLSALLTRIETLTTRRNEFVHSFWIGSGHGLQADRFRFKMQGKWDGITWRPSGTVQAAEIEEPVSEIEAARNELTGYLESYPEPVRESGEV